MKKILEWLTVIIGIGCMVLLCITAIVFFWDKPQTAKNGIEYFIKYWYLIVLFIVSASVFGRSL